LWWLKLANIVVIDSNIWLAEQMLRHGAGSALRFFLRTSGARVAVPEVIRREVVRHLLAELQRLSQQIQHSHGRLLRHVGSLKELVRPSSQDLEAAATHAFERARLDIMDVPFSIESARASFEKCLAGEPPSAPKDQQFKDGVVWADCVRLAADNPVLLVSADKGFFRNRRYEDGLAPNLAAESQATHCGITLVHELAAVLQSVQTRVSIDYQSLARRLPSGVLDKIGQWIGQHGFVVGDLVSGQHRLFATDDPARGHLEFELSYRCVHPDEREGTLLFRGECSFSPDTGGFGAIEQKGEEFRFVDLDGQQRTVRAVYMVGEAFLGHRTIHHEVRVPLNDEA
jgi:hypothetical protein